MQIFQFRDRLVRDHADFIRSFITIRGFRIAETVGAEPLAWQLWPEHLIQFNPFFERGESVDVLTAAAILHPECCRIFDIQDVSSMGFSHQLYRQQSRVNCTAVTSAEFLLSFHKRKRSCI